MITNKESYLFLKQCLILLQIQRDGGEVTIDNTVMVETSVYNKALTTLENIRDDFVLPVFVEATQSVFTNFLELADGLNTLQGDVKENSELARLLAITTLELDQVVLSYPVLSPLIAKHRANQQLKKEFTFSPELAERLQGELVGALNMVQYWIESPASSRSVLQMLLLINMVQLAEEMVEFCNDFYIGC